MAENAFHYFMGRRSARVVQLLEKNHDVSEFIQGMLEHLVDYAAEQGCDFADLHLDRPHVTRDNQLVSRILIRR